LNIGGIHNVYGPEVSMNLNHILMLNVKYLSRYEDSTPILKVLIERVKIDLDLNISISYSHQYLLDDAIEYKSYKVLNILIEKRVKC